MVIDFDVFINVCLEAWKRQELYNQHVFESIFEHFAVRIDESKPESDILDREGFGKAINLCAVNMSEEEIEKLWIATSERRISKSGKQKHVSNFAYL